MSRIILLAPLCVLLMVGPALGTPVGPAPPAGWGHDCTNWITYSTPWTGHLLYNPQTQGWLDCLTQNAVAWPPLDIEMWIEMECLLHWDATAVQIHRASDYGAFYIYLPGWSKCNHGQYVITTPPTAEGDLNHLPFVSGVAGSYNATYDVDIPLTWEVTQDGGATYTPMIEDGGSKYFLVDACDQYWTVRVLVEPIYHQGDGYYWLGGDGCYICPAEPL